MAASARDLKLRLLFDYQTGGLKAAVADIAGLSRAAGEGGQGLSAVAEGLDEVGASAQEASSGLAQARDQVDSLAAAGGRLGGLDLGGKLLGASSLLNKGLAAAAGAALAAGTAVAAIGLSAAGDAIQGVKNLQAELGVSESVARHLGDVGKEVFRDNWGGSISEAQSAVGLFVRAFDFDIPREELKTVTEQAFALQQVLDLPVEEQARAVSVLAANFDDVAQNGTKGLDQIAKVLQSNDANADDLLETIGEYSPLFNQLGFSSEQFFGILQSGLQAGARDTDFVADLVKEFGIRITDSSDTTNEALANLGLAGLGEQVRAGTVSGVEAFQLVQEKLGELPEGMRAAAGGVALMGTKFEDLGPAVVAALSTDPLSSFEGAALDAGNTASSSLGSIWETIKRNAVTQLGTALEPFVVSLQEQGPQILGAILPKIQELGTRLADVLSGIDLDALVDRLPGLLDTLIEKGAGLASTLGRFLDFIGENPALARFALAVTAIVAAIAPVAAILAPIISAAISLGGVLGPMVTAAGGLSAVLGTLAAILTGPVALSIGAVVGAFLLWRAKGDEIQAWLTSFGDRIKGFFSGLSDVKLPDLSGLLSGLTSIKLPSFSLASMFGGEGEAEAAGAAAGAGLATGLSGSLSGFEFPQLPPFDLGAALEDAKQAVPQFLEDVIEDVSAFVFPDLDLGGLDVSAQIAAIGTTILDGFTGFLSGIIQPAQQAIFDYLHEQWLAIPEDIRADLLLIASELRERFDEFLLTVQTKTAEIRSDIQARFDEVVAIVTSALSAAYAVAQEKFEEIRLAITTAAVAARDAAADVFGQIASAIRSRVDEARAAVQQGFDRVRIAAEERLDAARDAIAARVEAWRALVQAKVAELVAAAHAAFDPIVARLREVADRAVASLREGLARARDAVITPILDALASLAAAATDAKERALGIARGVIDGLLSGIRSGKQAVVDLLLDIVRGALDQVKAFLGMNSPARRLIPFGVAIPEGLAVGIMRGTPLAVAAALAMARAVSATAAEIEPFSSGDFFLVDEAAEQRFLADALSQLAALEAELDAAGAAFKRAQDRAEAAKGPIQAALESFFSAGGADGLSGIVSQIEQLSGSGLGADFFTNAGLDAEGFADLQRQIEALADEPAKQQQLWQSMIDALGERWKDYYDEQLEAEEKKAKALKRSIQEAKKAGPDADTSGLDSQLAAVEERIANLKDQNDQVADTLKEQASTVGNQFERYERLAKVASERKQDEEAARRALEEQRRTLEALVKERQGQALDAETQASELAGRLLDDELEREERNHNARLRFLDAQISAEEEALRQSLADEEERHTEALANITAEVDARQAAIDAQMDDLSRAKNLLDSFAKGNALTGEQSDFLRSLGLDPEVLGDAAVGLAETQKQVESLQGLLSRLDKGSSKRITKDQISQAERQALEDLKASGKLTKDEARRVDVALQSKGGISQKQLAALLERAAGGEKGSEGFLQQQLTQQEQGLDLLEKEIARREAKAKATQDDLAAERAGLQGLIDAEEHRHEAALAGARDRLTALNAERDAEEASFRDFQDHIREAKDAEKNRHDERMRQIQEQYALELLRLGKTEEEVRQILKEQEQRAAAIAEEARRRADAAKAEAAAADSRVDPTSPPSAEPPPASSGGEPPFAPLPIQPIIPPGSVDGLRSQLEDGDITGGLAASLADDLRAGTHDGLRALKEDGALAGRDFAAALLDPALESVAALRGRMVDIRSLATDLGLTPSLASGDVAIDRRIVFNGPVTLDHELAEELGILDVARTGAP